MTTQKNHSFAVLFKKFRLRSEIETLAQFGDLLAQEGLIYEDSLFTRWQKGERIPKDRKILLKIIELFVKRGGINNSEEANKLLAAVQMRDLSDSEKKAVRLSPTQEQSSFINARFPDITYRETIGIIFKSLIQSRYFYWIAGIYILMCILFLRLKIFNLYNAPESNIPGMGYSLINLSSIFYVFYLFKNNPAFVNSKYFKLVLLLAMGLLSQWIGLVIWYYYTLIGIRVPYPSFADLGYFGLIPLYMMAAVHTLRINNLLQKRLQINRQTLFLISPILLLIACYSIFLHISGFIFARQIRIILDALYPLGEIAPILTVVFVIVTKKEIEKFIKMQYFLLIFAFFMQFVTDYAFIYAAQLNIYINGGFNDFLYATAYAVMNLVIISFASNSLYNPVTIIAKSKRNAVKKNKLYLAILPLFHLWK